MKILLFIFFIISLVSVSAQDHRVITVRVDSIVEYDKWYVFYCRDTAYMEKNNYQLVSYKFYFHGIPIDTVSETHTYSFSIDPIVSNLRIAGSHPDRTGWMLNYKDQIFGPVNFSNRQPFYVRVFNTSGLNLFPVDINTHE